MKARWLTHMATLGPVGFFPFGPGTWGTLATVPVVWALLVVLKIPQPIYIIITLAVIVLGTLACSEAEVVLGKKDPGCVVIDEFAGYMVAMIFLPATPFYLISAFILFRFFDILKPPPIKRLEKIKGGWGIMVDDLAAGAITNVLLQIWLIAT